MAFSERISNSLVFAQAGSYKITRIGDDGVPSKLRDDIYTNGQNLVGVINTAWALETEELRDENSTDPRGVFPTKTTETIGIELRSEDPYLDLFLKGGVHSEIKDGVQEVNNIAGTIKADATPATKGEIKLLKPSGTPSVLDTAVDVLVRDVTTGGDYTIVTAPPAKSGECSVDHVKGTFTFHLDDIDKKVFISAGVKVESIIQFSRTKDAKIGKYRLELFGEVTQHDKTNEQYLHEIYPTVQLASGELASAARQLSPNSSKTVPFQKIAGAGCEGSTRRFSKIPVDTKIC